MSDSALSTRQNPVTSFISRRWAVLFLILEAIVFSIVAQGFFTLNVFQLVFIYGMPLFLLGVGETFVIITGGIDLSVGFIYGFASIIAAKLIVAFEGLGMGSLEAILLGCAATLIIGLVPGYINGLLVARLHVPPFIATYSMLSATFGVSEILVKGSQAGGLPYLATEMGGAFFAYFVPGKGFSFFSHGRPAPGAHVISILPVMVVITFVVILIFAFVLRNTRFGQHTYAIGGSEDAAVKAGINVKRHIERIYMISSLLATLAGIIYMLQYVEGKADAGASYLLDSIVAVVIGGASLYGGVGTIGGTLIGAILLSILETGLTVMALPNFTIYIAVGVILIIAVLVDQFLPERTESNR